MQLLYICFMSVVELLNELAHSRQLRDDGITGRELNLRLVDHIASMSMSYIINESNLLLRNNYSSWPVAW